MWWLSLAGTGWAGFERLAERRRGRVENAGSSGRVCTPSLALPNLPLPGMAPMLPETSTTHDWPGAPLSPTSNRALGTRYLLWPTRLFAANNNTRATTPRSHSCDSRTTT